MGTCPNCHISHMDSHPELYFWHKCSICGYSAILLNELSPTDQLNAQLRPLTKHPLLEAIDTVEKDQKVREKEYIKIL